MHSNGKFNQWFNYDDIFIELLCIWSYIPHILKQIS